MPRKKDELYTDRERADMAAVEVEKLKAEIKSLKIDLKRARIELASQPSRKKQQWIWPPK